MPLFRLIYFSENHLDTTQRVTPQLSAILSKSNANNRRDNITGALMFDDLWFIQTLEGERDAVWGTYRRIIDDERHRGATVIDARAVDKRLFGNWWMGLAQRNRATEQAFVRSGFPGRLDPQTASAEKMLGLMVEIAQI
ncbi:MAG: BLUF domain-containing protein, partial [Methylobacteriaceae bacterium]|nr:BLUF domain-containing protein [Methylobacteriaceae bacterium]